MAKTTKRGRVVVSQRAGSVVVPSLEQGLLLLLLPSAASRGDVMPPRWNPQPCGYNYAGYGYACKAAAAACAACLGRKLRASRNPGFCGTRVTGDSWQHYCQPCMGTTGLHTFLLVKPLYRVIYEVVGFVFTVGTSPFLLYC